MYGFFVVVHILICITLILIVLFQAGKGAGLGNLMGGGGGRSVIFGSFWLSFHQEVHGDFSDVFYCDITHADIFISTARSKFAVGADADANCSGTGPVNVLAIA